MSARSAPISSHAAFPAVVALWFAILLGLGSLIAPVALWENAVSASGLPSIVSAAQAPLGMTARLLIAVAAASIGAFAGVLVARRITALQAPAQPAGDVKLQEFRDAQQFDDQEGAAKRPIFAHEELDAVALDDLEDATDGNETTTGETDSGIDEADAPLELALDDAVEERTGPAGSESDVRPTLDTVQSTDSPTDEADDFDTQEQPMPEQSVPAGDQVAAVNPELADRPLHDLGMVELVERFALALQKHGQATAEGVGTTRADEPVAPKTGIHTADFGLDPEGETAEEQDPSGKDFTYSSLLTMKSAPRPGNEDEIEPEPADKVATERALREALEKLQKLSGAA